MNPHIFAGLDETDRHNYVYDGSLTQQDYQYQLGAETRLSKLSEALTFVTGYTPNQLRSGGSRVGILTARQAFCLIALEFAKQDDVADFVDRDRTTMSYILTNVKERLGVNGYELLTSIYNDVKNRFEE